MVVLHWLFTLWFVIWFLIGMVVVYPLFIIGIQIKGLKKLAHFGNILWTYMFYIPCVVIYKKEYRSPKPLPGPAVYCANHSSYLDIPGLFLIIVKYFKIIGKAELGKVPLFGYMFRNLYISVNRKGVKSRAETLRLSEEAIREGFNVGYFPEGTIPNKENVPEMIKFKDGPFRVAIATQAPIIPVTFPYNYKFLHDAKFPLKWHPLKAIIHEPISTEGMTLDDVPELRERTRTIIAKELEKHHPHLRN